jgi:hypothetical protein
MDNYTNGKSIFNENFKIEEWVRRISKFPNVFTIAFFDCCRIKIDNKGDDGRNKQTHPTKSNKGQYYII